jgi:adenylate kinase
VVKRYINKGQLVPDKIITRIMKERIVKFQDKNKILDGFPRNKKQIQALEKLMQKIDEKIDLVIYLKVEEDELITRLTGRRICRLDGSVYHIKYDPPQKEGKCDKCGANLYQREDDKKNVVKKKTKVNNEEITRVKKYYQNKGILKNVNSTSKKPEKVAQEIENIIKVYREEL